MGQAITVLSISCAYALFLILRVKSILGTKILVLSGNNLFNAKGIQLSEGGLFFLWLIAIAGIGTGIYMLVQHFQNQQSEAPQIDDDTKTCPMCAEKIKLEAKICKHCGNKFTEEEIVKLKTEILAKKEREEELKKEQAAEMERMGKEAKNAMKKRPFY